MTYTEKKRKLLRKLKTKTETTKYGIEYEIFSNAPKSIKLTTDDIGKRVWIASDFRTKKAYLDLIQDGSAKLKLKGDNHKWEWVFIEEIILHPSEWKGRI